MSFCLQVFLGAVLALLLDWAYRAFIDWLLRRQLQQSADDADPQLIAWQYDPAVGQYLPPQECDYDSLRNERHV